MTDDAGADDPERSKSGLAPSDPSPNDPSPDDAVEAASESDLESDSSAGPPPCPRCDTPVVMVTTTGPDSHYASCGCRLTHGEAMEFR